MMLKIAIVGGGITGCCVASNLAKLFSERTSAAETDSSNKKSASVQIHLFDQGRSGVGGRTSHRVVETESSNADGKNLFRFDHGCQFFRCDTSEFQKVNEEWMQKGFTREWKGSFGGDGDFFGLPQHPPFYTASAGGIKNICSSIVQEHDDCINVNEGVRVIGMEQAKDTKKWKLFGNTGEAALHDTPEHIAQAEQKSLLGHDFDAVVLTDLSSCFDSWHRASSGTPPDFAERVRQKAGSRVPLFTCMIAFESRLDVELDAFSVKGDDTLWFAARTNSKPGLHDAITHDCWTLVSTPEYAMKEIEATPMQNPETGEFIPQSRDYLTTVPGPALEKAFRAILQNGKYAKPVTNMPATVHLGAQRWGSALPAHRHLSPATSSTHKVIAGVSYDSGRAPLAPTNTATRLQQLEDSGSVPRNFVADQERMLFHAGDMVSSYTPGFESAALSGIETAHHMFQVLTDQHDKE